jgi:hypothetical protein
LAFHWHVDPYYTRVLGAQLIRLVQDDNLPIDVKCKYLPAALSIRRCRPPDRDRLIRSHLDATTDFAPSGSGLEPEDRGSDSA